MARHGWMDGWRGAKPGLQKNRDYGRNAQITSNQSQRHEQTSRGTEQTGLQHQRRLQGPGLPCLLQGCRRDEPPVVSERAVLGQSVHHHHYHHHPSGETWRASLHLSRGWWWRAGGRLRIISTSVGAREGGVRRPGCPFGDRGREARTDGDDSGCSYGRASWHMGKQETYMRTCVGTLHVGVRVSE